MKLKQFFISLAILLTALWVSACGQASSQNTPSGHEQHESRPEQAGQSSRTVKVNTTDAMRFTPETVTVQAGEIIRFEVTNTGVLAHEFIVGPAHLQAEHAQAMAAGGQQDKMHHEGTSNYALTIQPGETASLIYPFNQPGDLFYGCHVPGHYAAGMKGTITVTAVN